MAAIELQSILGYFSCGFFFSFFFLFMIVAERNEFFVAILQTD